MKCFLKTGAFSAEGKLGVDGVGGKSVCSPISRVSGNSGFCGDVAGSPSPWTSES